MATDVQPADRGLAPFDMSGIERGPDGIARYVDRPASLVEMLRTSVERSPQAPAIVEVGGPKLTYQELWDRSARVSGGLRAAGIKPGDRVAILLGNGADWVLAFWGGVMAGAPLGPVYTRLTEGGRGYRGLAPRTTIAFKPGRAPPAAPPHLPDELPPPRLPRALHPRRP